MRRALAILAAFVALPTRPATDHQIRVQLSPPQLVKAIALRTAATTRSLEVANGVVSIPDDLIPPFTVSLSRFEPTTYTAADLSQHRPLLLRELGILRGRLRRPAMAGNEHVTFILIRAGSKAVDEIPLTPSAEGVFETRLAEGLYEGAILGERTGSRIRPGIVMAAGQQTDLGDILCTPTATVAFRVVDAKRRQPVARASVAWDPPGIMNSDTARLIYARRWSAVTDARGRVTFSSVGPAPVPLRWRIRAEGHAATATPVVDLKEPRALMLTDVALRSQAAIVARIALPKDASDFRGASLELAEANEDPRPKFISSSRVPLHEGTITLPLQSYGRKRLSIESSSGRKLLYREVDAGAETTIVDLAPVPITVHGTVRRRGEGLAGAFVQLVDRHDSKIILGSVNADLQGAYDLRTYQSGDLLMYAMEPYRPGRDAFAAHQEVALTAPDYRADFELPPSGGSVRIVDGTTGAAIRATIDCRLEFKGGGATMGFKETDDAGRLVFDGFPDGVAHLNVQARGYRAKTIDVPLNSSAVETTVALDRSGIFTGRVIGANGVPIPGARISGGYADEMASTASFQAVSDAEGRFHFDSEPQPGTTFYIAAAGHALGITTLETGRENIVTLMPPGRGVVYLLPGNAPPTKSLPVMAAPIDGDYIPQDVLIDLGELNGLNIFQLLGTARDGSVVLPQFLPPGTFNLYVARPGGKIYVYQKVGTVTLPVQGKTVIAFRDQ
jgi:protocatechuate 3,4-dioxygenase beta subunit